jgi:hypothetical protein
VLQILTVLFVAGCASPQQRECRSAMRKVVRELGQLAQALSHNNQRARLEPAGAFDHLVAYCVEHTSPETLRCVREAQDLTEMAACGRRDDLLPPGAPDDATEDGTEQ